MKYLSEVGIESRTEKINAANNQDVLKKYKNKEITMIGGLIYEDEKPSDDKQSIEINRYLSIKTPEGFISTQSPSVIRTYETILEAYKADNALDEFMKGVKVVVDVSESRGGREYMTLRLV